MPLAPGRAYTWRKFKVLVRQLPQNSRLLRAMPTDDSNATPDTSNWENTDKLLALIADLLLIGNWQRSGEKKKPRLIFAEDTSASKPKPSALPDDQVRDVLAKMREGEQP